VGIVSINDALRLAQEADLDLVEVAPTARPPVCKLMDYGKFKYESALKARESRKNQAQTIIKEIKLRPKIDPHDYGTKKSHVERFLRAGDKVKVTIMFRGREQSRPELGFRLLQRLAGDVEELGFVESQPRQDGRNMIMVIGPHRRKSEARSEARAERATRDAHHGERSRSRASAAPADAAPDDADAVDATAAEQPAAVSEQPAAVSEQPAAVSEQPAAVSEPPQQPSEPPQQPSEPPQQPSGTEAGEARARPQPATAARAGAARVAAAPKASARG
jgi:translation initiation factor IF-3